MPSRLRCLLLLAALCHTTAASRAPPSAGGTCVYTPAVLPRPNEEDRRKLPARYYTCSEPSLTSDQRAACLRCAGQRSRDACLRTTAAQWYGSDSQSCLWVGRGGALEVAVSAGINIPKRLGMWLAPTTCSVRLDYTWLNPSRAYTWAQFLATADGLNATGGTPSWGLGFLSQTSCMLSPWTHHCSTRLARPAAYTQALALFETRAIWTESKAVLQALEQTDARCPIDPNATCSSYPIKYQYLLRIIEEPCRRASPDFKGRGTLALAVPGRLVGPNPSTGSTPVEDVQFFFSEGHKAASWRIYSPRTPLFVGLFNSSYGVSWSACDWSVPDIKTCDWTLKATPWAVPGTACSGRLCTGAAAINPKEQHTFVITYAGPYVRNFTLGEGVVDQRQTPTTVLQFDMTMVPGPLPPAV